MSIINRIRKLNYEENYYIILAVAFCVALRIFTPQMIGFGGDDAVESWDMARRILFNTDYYIVHRTARFGTIIPIYLTQLVLGVHPIVYYAAPAIASVFQTVFFYRTADIIRGRYFAFVSTILYLSFPQIIRDMSHPRVSVFSTMFFLIAFYYALRFYIDSRSADRGSEPRIPHLLISGVSIFCMYMSKEDSLYYLPAIMLLVYLSRKRFSDLVIFGILPFSLFIGETCVYHFLTGFKYGRLSVMNSNHFDTVTPILSFLSLFDRFTGTNLRPYFRYPLFISILGGLYIVLKKRDDEKYGYNPVIFIVLSLFTYVFFLTFLVKSLHPLVPLNTFRTRYMNIIIPPMILIITYLVYDLYGIFKKPVILKQHEIRGAGFFRKNRKKSVLMILIVYLYITVIIFFSVYKKEAYKGSTETYLQHHPFILVWSYNKTITDWYDSGRPFLISGRMVKDDRYFPIVNTVNEWVKSGMTLVDACKRYGITVDEYESYKIKADEYLGFEAESYTMKLFIHPDIKLSGFESFEILINEKHYLVCYNSHLITKDEVMRDLGKNNQPYPEVIKSPLQVVNTVLKF